jgi:hypothetical protein
MSHYHDFMRMAPPEDPAVPVIVGVDFDNTIVRYDALLHTLACDAGWISPGTPRSKRLIRDAVRLLPEGEAKWQCLQAEIYGPRMSEAELIPGVRAFFAQCHRHAADVHIVSHKTRFAAAAPDGPNLQAAALDWLDRQGFLDGANAIPRSHVWFEPTRAAKLARIESLGCTHFIDDLEETFREPAFPADTVKLLFAPAPAGELPQDCLVFADWSKIAGYFTGSFWHG